MSLRTDDQGFYLQGRAYESVPELVLAGKDWRHACPGSKLRAVISGNFNNYIHYRDSFSPPDSSPQPERQNSAGL